METFQCISPGVVEAETRDVCLIATEREPHDEGRKLLTEVPCLKPKDIADCVMYVISTPAHVQVHEIIIKPIGEAF